MIWLIRSGYLIYLLSVTFFLIRTVELMQVLGSSKRHSLPRRDAGKQIDHPAAVTYILMSASLSRHIASTSPLMSGWMNQPYSRLTGQLMFKRQGCLFD